MKPWVTTQVIMSWLYKRFFTFWRKADKNYEFTSPKCVYAHIKLHKQFQGIYGCLQSPSVDPRLITSVTQHYSHTAAYYSHGLLSNLVQKLLEGMDSPINRKSIISTELCAPYLLKTCLFIGWLWPSEIFDSHFRVNTHWMGAQS